MADSNFKNAVETLKQLDKKIQDAQVEIKLREQRLAELRPKKDVIEQECQQEFGCSVKDLPALIADKEAEFVEAVNLLKDVMSHDNLGS